MHIDASDLRAVTALWGELSEIPMANAAEASEHCLSSLARILGASNAFWVAAAAGPARCGDPLHGWRPRAVTRLRSHPGFDQRIADVVRDMDAHVVDPMTLANAQHIGRTRAFLRAELVDDSTWDRSVMVNEILRPIGVGDRLISTVNLGPTHEAHLGLDRDAGERGFGARERDLLQFFLLGSRLFHHQQFLFRGAAQPALTPREREVLSLLLTEMTEREIGEALGLTWRTTHQYAASIFRKFGVRGRLGLTALWLSRWRGPPPAN